MTDTELLLFEDQAFVEQAYIAVLGRPGDPGGLASCLARLRAGTPKAQLLSELRTSLEGSKRVAQLGLSSGSPRSLVAPGISSGLLEVDDLLRLGDEGFVEQAYRLTLGRSADVSGMQNYLRELRMGVGRLDVLQELLQSVEGLRVGAPLPTLRAMLARRRVQRLPGVRHALRALRLMRSRIGSSATVRRHGVTIPKPHSVVGEGQDPMRPRSGVRRGGRPQPYPMTMKKPSADSDTFLAGAPPEAVRAKAAHSALEPAAESDRGVLLARAPTALGDLHAESIAGAILRGWSAVGGRATACSVSLEQRTLGRIVPDVPRPEIQSTHGLIDTTVGFASVLGGLLQFSAMAPDCSILNILQEGEGGTGLEINLQQHLPEALTFSPMRALLRPMTGKAGQIRSMRLTSATEAAIIFEADSQSGDTSSTVFIDFYQEQNKRQGTERLTRIARFGVALGGQLHDLEFRLLDVRRPLLMVVTDAERAILVTDCFPLPVLFAESNAPLIEYHVTLESGKSSFGVAAKIARTYLDAAVIAQQPQRKSNAPSIKDTCIILYCRGQADTQWKAWQSSYAALAAEVTLLGHDGLVHSVGGVARPLGEHMASSPARYFLLHDAETELRPDFWAVINGNAFRLADSPAIVHWHSLWIDGVSRPQVVKAGLLLHPAFTGHQLLETRSLLVSRAALGRAVREHGQDLASGRLVLERVFDTVEPASVVCLPLLMHTVRTPIVPLQAERFRAEHTVTPEHPGQVDRAAVQVRAANAVGVSVIINYRDSVYDTLRCLESLATQELDGPLEIVLVNNGSTLASVDSVLVRARDLFGREQVTAIDYPHRFNHSTQCNVAAQAARHELLLMLSNDSVLLTPRAVARSAAVAAVPWVGSVGFRIIGTVAGKKRLQSLGLTLNSRRYLFSGGSPVSTNLAPAFALDCTFEVVGNTFAAVMLRREVFRQLDGLDSDAFPTSYNDIDFSFRATNAGYRHVVVGSEVVEHVGRGSREADQDLPIDQRIIERAPRLDVLARVGFQQL